MRSGIYVRVPTDDQKEEKIYQNNLILFLVFLDMGIKSMSSQHWIYTLVQIRMWEIPTPFYFLR